MSVLGRPVGLALRAFIVMLPIAFLGASLADPVKQVKP